MKYKKIIIALIIIAVIAAVLVTIALVKRSSQNNSQPANQKDYTLYIPEELSDYDREQITQESTLFLEQFGRFDPSTNYQNINSAATHTTGVLAQELIDFEIKKLAEQEYPVPLISADTIVVVKDIHKDLGSSGEERVIANVEGVITYTQEGLKTEKDFSGYLSLVKADQYWYVDDMDIEPDFLGFK